MSVKPTPGPWVAHCSGMDAKVSCPDGRSFLVGDVIYHPENGANARLIAAAPDLLAALKAMLSSPTYGNDPSEAAVVMAEAAIARADGPR